MIGYALFFAAWVGHSALWLVGLNILYSQPLDRTFLKLVRLAVGVIVFGFPFFLWAVAGLDLLAVSLGNLSSGSLVLQLYLAQCFFITFWAIPMATLVRLLRRRPPQLAAKQSEVVDVARDLGRKPVGRGHYWPVALLPGNQLFQVEFTELDLRIPDLPPAWDGLSILHLSDLHLHGTPNREFHERVIERCRAWGRADILAVTGDLVDSDTHHRWLMRLLHPLEWTEAGFAILGNHDFHRNPERVRRRLRRLGMTVLGNRWVAVPIRGVPMTAIGHEGPWFRGTPDLSDCPADPFRLLLSHTPDNIGWARRNNVRLMLSGHVHGGQIRLPLFGSLFVPSKYSRRYDQGVFWEPPTLLSVTRGVAGKEPLRYNCRPEVIRLVLRPTAKT